MMPTMVHRCEPRLFNDQGVATSTWHIAMEDAARDPRKRHALDVQWKRQDAPFLAAMNHRHDLASYCAEAERDWARTHNDPPRFP